MKTDYCYATAPSGVSSRISSSSSSSLYAITYMGDKDFGDGRQF